MRTLLATTIAVVVLASGCGGTAGPQEPESRPAPSGSPRDSSPSPPVPGPSRVPSPAPAAPGVAASRTCEQVRIGIIAFNLGQYDETVRRFQEAVPLALRQADGSRASEELVAAVRYYAGLAAEDYPAAAQGSADFAKYKAITLGQCGDGIARVPQAPAPSGPPRFET